MLNRFISKLTKIKQIKLLPSKFSCEFNNTKPSIVRTMAMNSKNNYEAKCKDKAFQSVPNILIATDNDEGFVSLKRKLKNVVDPSKVLRLFLCNY